MQLDQLSSFAFRFIETFYYDVFKKKNILLWWLAKKNIYDE